MLYHVSLPVSMADLLMKPGVIDVIRNLPCTDVTWGLVWKPR